MVKYQIVYAHTTETIFFEHYQKRDIQRWKIVHYDTIDYRYKYTNRSTFKN
ncbi:MAG: hypothetical protein ACMUEM_01150 [Flavobacteriales bacterium AspAUS03]